MSDFTQRKVGVGRPVAVPPPSASPSGAPNRWAVHGVWIGLVLATALAYAGVRANEFVHFDDDVYVTNNPQVRAGLGWAGIKWAFTAFQADNWHPLTWISHMLDVQLFGMSAGAQHLVNVAFHIGNALLLFAFLRCTTRRVWPSGWVAGMFALHPLHVESVAWIAERKDVLSTFFWLLTLLAYAGYVKQPGWKRYAGVVALFALGLLAKPMLVTLPFVLLLVDYWPLERYDVARKRPWVTPRDTTLAQILWEKVPLVALACGSALVTLQAQRAATPTWWVADAATRVTNAAVSYVRYLWMMVWPVDLAVLYPHPRRPLYLAAAVSALVVVTITAAALAYGRRYKFVPAGWLWYLGTLVPVIGLVQVGEQSHADRYTYIPLIGIFVVLAWSATTIVERAPRLRDALAITGCTVLAAAGVLTAATVKNWKDDLTLFDHAVNTVPGNFVMLRNLGMTLASQGQSDRAQRVFLQALQIKPKDRWVLARLGSLYFNQRQYAQAVEYAQAAIDIDPLQKEAQFLMGSALVKLGRYADAEPHCRKAVEIDPAWAVAHSLLGAVLGKLDKLDEAVAASRRAVELAPSAAAWNDLASQLARAGRFAEAVDGYRKSIRLDTSAPGAYYKLAEALEKLGRFSEALEAARAAQARAPGNEQAEALVRRLSTVHAGVADR